MRWFAWVLVLGSCLGEVTEPLATTVDSGADASAVVAVDAGVVTDAGSAGDAGEGVDAGLPDAGRPDAGVPDAGPALVPIFFAQGKLGRTTISCDDGKTWVANHSEVPDGRCWDDTSPNNIECDHHEWSSVGTLFSDGFFFATWGWGHPGVVRRSADGVNWVDVFAGHTFAGLAAGNGKVVGNDRPLFAANAEGAEGSWQATAGDLLSPQFNVRKIAFLAPTANARGRFLVTLESSAGDIAFTDNDGASWTRATTLPSTCAHQVGSVVEGNGVVVLTQSDGSVCRSTDRGVSWQYVTVTTSFSSNALFTDSAFVVWDGATRWRSADGLSWTSTAGGPAGVNVGAVARGPSGTYVAVLGGWQVWYDKQRFYRSTDGVTWTVLPQSAFVPSHPITSLLAGWAAPSPECPLR